MRNRQEDKSKTSTLRPPPLSSMLSSRLFVCWSCAFFSHPHTYKFIATFFLSHTNTHTYVRVVSSFITLYKPFFVLSCRCVLPHDSIDGFLHIFVFVVSCSGPVLFCYSNGSISLRAPNALLMVLLIRRIWPTERAWERDRTTHSYTHRMKRMNCENAGNCADTSEHR